MNTIKELKKDINKRLESYSIDEVKEYVWELLTKEDNTPQYTEQDYINAKEEYYRLSAINIYSLSIAEQLEISKEYNRVSCKYFTIKSIIEKL